MLHSSNLYRKMAGNLGIVDKPESRNIRRIVATALPLLFLAIPSLWLIAAVPPLWRGSDAYVQTVFPPGAATILRHGPLYCVLSRVPLWLGYLISRAGPVVSLGHFIKHSQLTDAGVFALIIVQHVSLWCAALYLIQAIARTLFLRLFLAVFFATHPLFYTFAHCIGSETLSMILALFLAGSGVRVLLLYPKISLHDWIVFSVLLSCCILTRHINCVLAVMLPVTMLLLTARRCLRISVHTRDATPNANLSLSKATYVWLISIAAALISLLFAASFTHLLCWRAHTQWRSTFGFTFAWRLNFLAPMPTMLRNGLLDNVASKCKLAETRQLIAILKDQFGKNKPWDPARFLREEVDPVFNLNGKLRGEKFDRSLNEMANAFLWPPSAAFRCAALHDFRDATALGEGDVVQFLFTSTNQIFDQRERMPQFSRLKTFRESGDELMRARKRLYFRWWNVLSLRSWVVITCIVFLLTLV